MLRIYKDPFVPKYKCGKWIWDEETEKIKFIAKEFGRPEPETVLPSPVQVNSIKFKDSIDQVEELIMRKIFYRDHISFDADVITVQDIKNLVLFLAPSEVMTRNFIDFIYSITVDKFLNALIIYFEYFLKIVEYLLIERDDMSDEVEIGKIQGLDSIDLKKMLSEYLSQYRLLIAREYSKIVLGTHDMKNFHHLTMGVNISKTIKDRKFHEDFIAFSTQIVWIAMHRRAYKAIDNEMNRIFRSGHFNLTDKGAKKTDYIEFTKVEQQVLYGKNDKRSNFRAQNSPIIQEISNVALKHLPILWIGEKKYRGTDKRILELELEFVIPDSQLSMIDVSHGILGHPKKFYNTMLSLDWTIIRSMNYNLNYDPYRLVRTPNIDMPKWENFNQKHETYDSYFELKDVRYEKEIIEKQKNIWKKRDKIVKKMKENEIANDILLSCHQEINELGKEFKIDYEVIIKNFLEEKHKLRKK